MKVALVILSSLAATLAGPQVYGNRLTMMMMMMMMMSKIMLMMMTSAPPTHWVLFYQGDFSWGSPVFWRPDHQLCRMGIHCRFLKNKSLVKSFLVFGTLVELLKCRLGGLLHPTGVDSNEWNNNRGSSSSRGNYNRSSNNNSSSSSSSRREEEVG